MEENVLIHKSFFVVLSRRRVHALFLEISLGGQLYRGGGAVGVRVLDLMDLLGWR